MLLVAVAMVGLGSAVFHPESSRVARLASGGRYGLAQSVFQVGGNAGSSIGPLAAAFVVLPGGQRSVAWFSSAALLGIVLLTKIGGWYKHRAAARVKRTSGDVNKAGIVVTKDRGRCRRSARTHFFEVLLSREPEQLLHLLPDLEVRRVRTEGSGVVVRLPGCGCGRHDYRRTGGR